MLRVTLAGALSAFLRAGLLTLLLGFPRPASSTAAFRRDCCADTVSLECGGAGDISPGTALASARGLVLSHEGPFFSLVGAGGTVLSPKAVLILSGKELFSACGV